MFTIFKITGIPWNPKNVEEKNPGIFILDWALSVYYEIKISREHLYWVLQKCCNNFNLS